MGKNGGLVPQKEGKQFMATKGQLPETATARNSRALENDLDTNRGSAAEGGTMTEPLAVRRDLKLAQAIHDLMAAYGFNQLPESADDLFLTVLRDATVKVAAVVEKSHNDGLLIDVVHALADELGRTASDAVHEYELAHKPTQLNLTVEMTLEDCDIDNPETIAQDLEGALVKVKEGVYENRACGYITKVEITEPQPAEVAAAQTNTGG
jgi:hypothetical protein